LDLPEFQIDPDFVQIWNQITSDWRNSKTSAKKPMKLQLGPFFENIQVVILSGVQEKSEATKRERKTLDELLFRI